MCINSDELGAMYYIGGPRLPLIQAAEVGLSSTQADGMTIITGIYKMKFQSNSNYESGFDPRSLFEPPLASFSVYLRIHWRVNCLH